MLSNIRTVASSRNVACQLKKTRIGSAGVIVELEIRSGVIEPHQSVKLNKSSVIKT